MMSLGFFPIPPTVRKLFSSLTLASVPTSGLWGVGPEALGAGLQSYARPGSLSGADSVAEVASGDPFPLGGAAGAAESDCGCG